MASRKGRVENLSPVRSKEEARRRGRNGGIKSGEVRRKKRDAKSAARLILSLPATEGTEEQLRKLGVEDESEYTNMLAIMGRAFAKAMTGDIGAMSFLLDVAVESPRSKMAEESHERAMESGLPADDVVDDWVNSIPEYKPDGE